MKVSEIIRPVSDGCELDILVSPRSNRNGPEGVDEWRKMLILRVRAPPLDGRANKEIQELFRKVTGCKCEIVRGQTSRQKTVFVMGDPEKILDSLRNGL